jgi:hypothetical protein
MAKRDRNINDADSETDKEPAKRRRIGNDNDEDETATPFYKEWFASYQALSATRNDNAFYAYTTAAHTTKEIWSWGPPTTHYPCNIGQWAPSWWFLREQAQARRAGDFSDLGGQVEIAPDGQLFIV